MTKAIGQLKASGQEISNEVLAALSPYLTSHINRFGQPTPVPASAGPTAVGPQAPEGRDGDRVKAGIAQARKQKIKELFRKGLSKREIAKRIGISRTSVRRLLAPG